ncbi:hypothetical protein CAPTEDRAFT_209614 [Capitella teleta]|uniref:Uncharacterized protein n=1 Tax=Capitella teleta TaxID=283909 RepID=R7TA24_CAPTE|nr:hypothetical protein CAPTEDRAFT_209614 [Capitella teleta]|eukprot:ELT90564.1 hypothetical protein CAPTEDRAFT_209614 [Capitella teleta]
MLAALGIGKKKAASEEQIRKHQEAKQHHDKWLANVQKFRDIAQKLETKYSAHKGDFALGRYDELKAMIKSSIKEYESCLEEMQKKGLNKSRGGKTGSLMGAAATFASVQTQVSELEESYSKTKKMTSEQVSHETASLRKQSAALQREYQSWRANLERLAKEYEESKKYNPTQRYGVLKALIKDTMKQS